MAPKAKQTDGDKKAPRSDEWGAVSVPEPMRFLTDKELQFCIEYSVSGNATQAYQKAFKCGYNTARAEGCRIQQDTAISQTIDTMRQERLERLKIDKDDVFRRIVLAYTYDAGDFFDDDGRLKPLSELHPDLRAVVEGMDVSEKITGEEGDGISRLMKIKLPRKLDALRLMGEHLRIFGDKQKEDAEQKPQRSIRIIKAEDMVSGN